MLGSAVARHWDKLREAEEFNHGAFADFALQSLFYSHGKK